VVLAVHGRFAEAEQQGRIAVAADPLSLVSRQDLSTVLLFAGKVDAAETEIRRALEIDPRYASAWGVLGSVLLAQGRADSALAALRRNIELDTPGSSTDDLAYLGYAYGVTGHRDSALAILHQLDSLAARQTVSATAFAIMELGLGHHDRAFTLFERAIDEHEGFMNSIFPIDPMFAPIRSDPRFKALKRRANLN
jgi:tetratricopeptide (TPR) repeat protein